MKAQRRTFRLIETRAKNAIILTDQYIITGVKAMKNRLSARPKLNIPRLTFSETFAGVKSPTDNYSVGTRFAEISSDGEFYAATFPIRESISFRVKNDMLDYKAAATQYLVAINEYDKFRAMPVRGGKSLRLAVNCAVAKLLLDYYLDEIELGNVIY